VEVVRTAALQGAQVANHVEAVGFELDGGTIRAVQAVDRVGGGRFAIRARQVLNATGPWVDAVCRLAGDVGPPHLRPTKGVHLVVPDRGLTAAFTLLHPADGRVLFVIPWLGKTLLGTTDTEYAAAPDDLSVTHQEMDYLLKAHNYYFSPPLTPDDVLSSFVGLRPLLAGRPGEPSARSREYRLFWSASGLLSVAGGKYTTYRRMAEVITDAIAGRLGRRRRGRTRTFRLDGTPGLPWDKFLSATGNILRARHGLSEAAARHLVSRYGRRAPDVAAYVERDPTLAEPVVAGEPDLRAEFVYQREHEMAAYPADFLLRRTRLGLFRPELLRSPPAEIVFTV
jgi:glycerol-3-phosphate dehydrogenase